MGLFGSNGFNDQIRPRLNSNWDHISLSEDNDFKPLFKFNLN